MQALVFDLGGTHLRCGVADASALRHVTKVRIDNFLGGHPPREIARRLVARMKAYEASVRAGLSPVAPIVVSLPGPVAERRRTLDAPTLFGRAPDPPDLAADLRRHSLRDVVVLNDLSAAAWRLSATYGVHRFLVVAISSGIGSKIFDARHPDGVLDDPPHAGEIGHTTVSWAPDAPRCDCGGMGHLGAIASGRGLERLARQRAAIEPAAFGESLCVTRFGARAETLTNEDHLVPAAIAGDRWSLAVVRDGTRPLARTLATVVLAAGVTRVVVTGGFASALGDVYVTLLRELLRDACDYRLMPCPTADLVQLADPGEEVCLEGAAAYARHLHCARRVAS